MTLNPETIYLLMMLDHKGGLELDLKVVQSLALGPRTLDNQSLGHNHQTGEATSTSMLK